MITLKKWAQLALRMQRLKIVDTDLTEKFIVGGGHGGQKLQKTASCVFIKHRPTGLQVKCQQSRLRDSNRYFARRLLCEKIETLFLKEKSEKQKQIEKIRRQKKKRSKRAKQKMLDEKHKQSAQKILRKTPNTESG